MERVKWIDGAKGIAILMVMSIHLMQYLPRPDWVFKIFFFGAMGVQLFFIMSAYCLCMTWRPEKFNRWYWLRKYRRLAPWYLFGIVFYAAYWLFVSKEDGIRYYTFNNVVANIFFLNGFVEDAQNTIVPGGWSISAIALFVFAFPLFAFMKRWTRVLVLIGCSVLFSGIMAYGYLHLGLDRQFTYCHPLCQFGVFAIGVIVWDYREALSRFYDRKKVVIVGGGLIFFLLCVLAVFLNKDMAILYRQYLISLTYVSVLPLLQKCESHIPSWLVWAGRHSYELFILHFAIIWILLK